MTTRHLVVIGGLPGSGKTTLLSSLLRDDLPGVVGLDSEQVTGRLRRAGVGLPYRLVRPWVHVWHRLRVVRAMRGPAPVVVVTDPMTSARRRAALLRAAGSTGRTVHLVLIDATAGEAAGGQTARGRALTRRAMRRHTGRWTGLLDVARSPGGLPGAHRTVLVQRSQVAGLGPREVLARVAPGVLRGSRPTSCAAAGKGASRSAC